MQKHHEIVNSPVERPNLAAYTNYRDYLKDFYECRRYETRASLRPYSYADFSAAADIRSPNYLKLIIEAKRNLSETMMNNFAKALQLQKDDSEEFKALVRYSQAVDPLERNQYLRELAELRSKRMGSQQNHNDGEQIPSWVTWAIYALADQRGVNFEPREIHEILGQRAKLSEVKLAFEKLLSSGELVRGDDGQVKRGLKAAGETSEMSSQLIRKLQAELIYLGMESLFHDKPTEREFGSQTLALTEEEFEALKFELRHMRKRVYKDNLIAREKTKGDRTYQLNIQLFPISKKV